VDCLEAVFQALAMHSPRYRILCGDFNTPQFEMATPFTVTWAQKLEPDGRVQTLRDLRGGPGERWDLAERNVLMGLAKFDLQDVFRRLHGYGMEAYSFALGAVQAALPAYGNVPA
jgi:exodeoxyribonuclease III